MSEFGANNRHLTLTAGIYVRRNKKVRYADVQRNPNPMSNLEIYFYSIAKTCNSKDYI